MVTKSHSEYEEVIPKFELDSLVLPATVSTDC